MDLTDGAGPHYLMMPGDPMQGLLDDIRDTVANLKPGQSICIHRVPAQPKVGEPLFTIYTSGTVVLRHGDIVAQEPA